NTKRCRRRRSRRAAARPRPHPRLRRSRWLSRARRSCRPRRSRARRSSRAEFGLRPRTLFKVLREEVDRTLPRELGGLRVVPQHVELFLVGGLVGEGVLAVVAVE